MSAGLAAALRLELAMAGAETKDSLDTVHTKGGTRNHRIQKKREKAKNKLIELQKRQLSSADNLLSKAAEIVSARHSVKVNDQLALGSANQKRKQVGRNKYQNTFIFCN
jgi:hypothetical protein